jgi:hypothetical protein
MQTLISVFEKRAAARRAVERLLQSGFSESDIHLHDSGEPSRKHDENHEQDVELGERVMKSVEREVAVDPEVFESISHFFSTLFGGGHDAGAPYSEAVQRGQSVLVVDASGDHRAELAAVILHEEGAVEVDDHRPHEVPEDMRRRVQKIDRPQQPPLRELVPRPGNKR